MDAMRALGAEGAEGAEGGEVDGAEDECHILRGAVEQAEPEDDLEPKDQTRHSANQTQIVGRRARV